MNKKFDYDALERQYIQGTMSLRELAESVEMKNHSLIMRQSKKRDWARKRAEYQNKANETALTVMADKRGNYLAREAAVKDNVVGAIDDMVTRLREDLKKTKTVIVNGVPEQQPLIRVTPNHIGMLIDKVQVIFGKPSSITEERNFGATVTGEADPDILRAFVEATRGVGLDSGPTAESPLPVPPEPRQN